jgi:arabinose-5-phosphate isomerase
MKFDLNYAKNVIESEAAAIQKVAKIIDKPFEQTLSEIYNCKGTVVVSGIGKAGIIGEKISATLASTGTPSHFLHPAEAVHGDLGRLRKQDLVLVLSYGGETSEITRLIELVKRLGIKMVALTGKENSTLTKYSDIVLSMGELDEACPLGVAPSVSTTCMLAVGDALSLTVMKAREFGVEDYVRFHPGGSLGAKLMTVEQSMMFKPNEELPIAGEGDTVKQMLEKNKDIKRHGAVMVVDGSGKLAGIITDADLRREFTQNTEQALSLKVKDIMTADCKKIRKDSLAAEATSIFHKFRIDELPVVDSENKPVGLIDVQDVLTIKAVG